MHIIVNVNSDINPIILSTLWRRPWLSAYQIAIDSKIDVATATQQLQASVMHGQVQSLSLAQSPLPAALYALTKVGAVLVAPNQGWAHHAKRLQFIRQHLIVHQHINALVAALSQAIPSWQAAGDTLISRIFQKSPLVLHGRLQLHIHNTPQPFYVLLDDGIGGPGRWAQQLRYYKRWSDQAQAQFPPLLLLCPNRFRSGVLLRLALEIGLRSPVFAAWQREIAFGNGLHQCEWLTWANNGVVAALPFGTAYPIANPHAHNNISTNGNLERRSKFSFTNILHPTSPPLPTPDDTLLSTLNMAEIHTLGFLVQHPVCPLNVIQVFTGLAEALAVDAIQKLVTLQLAAPVTLPNTQHPDSVWWASNSAVQQWAQQYGHDPQRAVTQYATLCRDRQRRPHHALAVFGFFERAQRDIAQRNRALTPRDAHGASHLGLTLFEDELHTRSSFRWRGSQHHWWPDGFGCVRSGQVHTCFWLEMDGSLHTPARSDPAAWRVKFDSLCAYIAAERWQFRSPVLPHLLIVTHDPVRCKRLIQDSLIQAAHTHGIEAPKIYIAAHTELQQRGPLSHCWLDAQQSLLPYPQWLTPFPDLQPNLVHSPLARFDLIAALRRAERAGVIVSYDPKYSYDLPHFPTL